jgi:pilus assembly protein FimV
MRLLPAVAAAVVLSACGSGGAAPASGGAGATGSAGASASTSSDSTASTTGIDVRALAGPTCPVQRAGQDCTRPISATVVITRQDGGGAAQVQTGTDGTAHVPLPPGSYTVAGLPGASGFPRAPTPQHATVTAGAYVTVQLVFDTGIR